MRKFVATITLCSLVAGSIASSSSISPMRATSRVNADGLGAQPFVQASPLADGLGAQPFATTSLLADGLGAQPFVVTVPGSGTGSLTA